MRPRDRHPRGERLRWEHSIRTALYSNDELSPSLPDTQGNLPGAVSWENRGHIFTGHGDL